MEPTIAERFDAWAVIELFGHQRIAGKVSETAIGGCSFLRVDVPATAKPGYTKLFGNGAIYSMTLCDEAVALHAAQVIERYRDPLPVAMPSASPRLTAGASEDEPDPAYRYPDDDDDDDSEDDEIEDPLEDDDRL